MNNQEEWKKIPGWEGIYSVSNLGNVRSEHRIISERRPNGHKEKTYVINEKILKQTPQPTGHLRVSLSKDSKISYRMTHTLVLLAFVGDKPEKTECCHIDGNPANNNLSNLYYGTRSQNISDAKRHETFPMGEHRPGALLNPQKALEIYKLCQNGMSDKEIANKFNVTKGCVVQIRLGKNWKEVTGGKPIEKCLYKYIKISDEHKAIIMDKNIKIMKAAKLLGIDRHTAAQWRKRFNDD